MKAAVWHGYKDVRIEDKPVPEPKAGQVRIKVDYAGICGTDRHEYVGPNFIPVTKPHRLTGRTAPLIIGHEFSGRIDALGEGVSGWKPGQRVTANGSLTCGECELCRSGRYNICKKLGFVGVGDDGCFAEYLVVGADKLFSIPDEVTQKEAAVAEPLACGIHATNLIGNLGGVKGKLAVIVGPGIIGIGAFYAAKLAGARKVLVIGHGEEKRTVIEKHGGEFLNTALLENGAADVPSYVEKWSDGALADVVYECIGAEATLDQTIRMSKPGGKLMVMGVFGRKPQVDMNTLQEAERVLYTSQAHVDEIATALGHLAEGAIPGKELITREVTLDTLVQDGFEHLIAHGPENIKVIIRIGGRE